jgi:hypothetical protein
VRFYADRALVRLRLIIDCALPRPHRRAKRHGVQCQNKLKQLALAFEGHHEQFVLSIRGMGLVGTADISTARPRSKQQRAGWGFQVLPFVADLVEWRVAHRGGSGSKQLAQNNLFFARHAGEHKAH